MILRICPIKKSHFLYSESIDSSLSDSDLKNLIGESYASFANKSAPISKISDNEYLLELFHGPTYAFKDIAMQFISRLMDIYLKKTVVKLISLEQHQGTQVLQQFMVLSLWNHLMFLFFILII